MNLEEKRRAYQAFFAKSEAGKEFMVTLGQFIDTDHRKAEKAITADASFAYDQRAAGVREVIEHIQVVTAERSKVAE